jgi:MFS family permease
MSTASGTLFGVDRRVIVLALARMADALGNSFLILVLPLYIKSGFVTGSTYGLTVSLITGLVLSMFGLLNSLLQPFTGRLSDRTGRRKVYVVLGLVVLTVSNFAFSLADGYLALLAIRMFQGVGVAFAITATIALVNELSTVDDRGRNLGVFNTFRLIGFGAGPLLAGAIVEAGPYVVGSVDVNGFDAAFYVAAAAALLSTLLVQAFVHDPEETTAAAAEDLSFDVRGDGQLLDPVLTLGLATLFMATGVALFSTIQPEINARLDQGPAEFGLQFSAFVGGLVITQIPVGRASDRYGRKPFIVAGLLILVPIVGVQGFVATTLQMTVARFLQGIAAALVFATSLALAGDLAKVGQSGTTLSVLTMAFGLGTATGPLTSGYLIRFGFAAPFLFAAGLAALGTGLVLTQVSETVPDAALDVPDPVAGED